jgi:hypothetical protein
MCWGHKPTPGLVQIGATYYNTSITDANYQNNPNNHKQNNYSSKENNPANKLDSEKLETELTNTYNQPITMV